MKVIALYLPQFHAIKENDEWWGEGFTEWVNVKKAKPLYKDHYQPRVPLEGNYYDLLDDSTMKWQIDLAKKYGVYGFCFYHYWFCDGKKLLEKPVEKFLEDNTLDINFCLSWANEPWTQGWVSKEDHVLMPQEYGNKDYWKKHFEYLLPYFMDERYICIEGKPFFVIYRPEIIECLNEMIDYWQELARENGLPGIVFAYQSIHFATKKNKDDSRFDYNIEYEPGYGRYDLSTQGHKKIFKLGKLLDNICFKLFKKKPSNLYLRKVRKENYDTVWEAIVNHNPPSSKSIPGAFVGWDNTPRRGTKGSVIEGATPIKFKKYFLEKLKKAKNIYNKDMIFVFAWNEWAEGGYLEPDERHKYGYLEAIKESLLELEEWPWKQ